MGGDAPKPLRLRVADAGDLEVLAALLQDSIVAAKDLRFLPLERRFALLANRFRWEGDAPDPSLPGERVLCALVFETVTATQSRGISRAGDAPFLVEEVEGDLIL